MHLVFIHGWGFDEHFWDPLAALLQFPQTRVDLGFFGDASPDVFDPSESILVGHSLGFPFGIRGHRNWAGWIAVNSFPCFVQADGKPGCVTSAVLRDMRRRLMLDPQRTLANFYQLIGATHFPRAQANVERLCQKLDFLRDINIGAELPQDTPGLVLAASNDTLVPLATSEVLQTANAQIFLHPEGGHVLPQSAAAWCAGHITGFLHDKFGEGA